MKKFFPLLFVLFLCSCGVFKNTPKESSLNYMQNIDSIATEASRDANLNTIQPGDQLAIVVSAKDLDVVRPFNQNFSSGQLIQQASSGGNIRSASGSEVSPTYLVDTNGMIDFPILGKLPTTGKTLEIFKEDLRLSLKKYLKDPVVSVKNTNYKVTILGEVRNPGQYIIADGHATLLNVLGLAGDLTMYGKRDNLLLVRNVNGEITKHRLDLTDAHFINSPYYHLKQGDVIYVSVNNTREKASRLNPNNGLYISIASIAITIVALIIRN